MALWVASPCSEARGGGGAGGARGSGEGGGRVGTAGEALLGYTGLGALIQWEGGVPGDRLLLKSRKFCHFHNKTALGIKGPGDSSSRIQARASPNHSQ